MKNGLLDDVVTGVEDEVGVLDGDVDDVVRRERRAADVLRVALGGTPLPICVDTAKMPSLSTNWDIMFCTRLRLAPAAMQSSGRFAALRSVIALSIALSSGTGRRIGCGGKRCVPSATGSAAMSSGSSRWTGPGFSSTETRTQSRTRYGTCGGGRRWWAAGVGGGGGRRRYGTAVASAICLVNLREGGRVGGGVIGEEGGAVDAARLRAPKKGARRRIARRICAITW